MDAVLAEIGAAERPRIVVLNKCDRLIAAERARTAGRRARARCSSPRCTGDGLTTLRRDAGAAALDLAPAAVRLRFHAERRRGIAGGLHGGARDSRTRSKGTTLVLDAEIPERLIERFREHVE